MRASRLLLVGVTHRDPGSGRRLLALLRREQPPRVLIEMSPASLAYRRGPGRGRRAEIRSLLARTAPSSGRAREARKLLAALAIPFELRAAVRYARERAVAGAARPTVVLADLSRYALPKLEELDDWAEEVIDRLVRGADGAPFPSEHKNLGKMFHVEHFLSDAEQRELEARDRHAARAIRRTMARHPRARITHVCGHEHLEPLAALLADLAPRTVRIAPRASVP